MRVAVCMSGHMRTYQKCYKALFEHLLNRYECDLFLYTWTRVTHNTRCWHDFNKDYKGVYIDLEDIERTYNPTAFAAERQVVKNKKKQWKSKDAKYQYAGIQFQWEAAYKSNQLRKMHQVKYGVSYDAVVKIRPDVRLLRPIELNPRKNVVVLSSLNENLTGATDVFACSCPETMDVYYDYALHLDKYFKTQKIKPELHLIRYLRDSKIRIHNDKKLFETIREDK